MTLASLLGPAWKSRKIAVAGKLRGGGDGRTWKMLVGTNMEAMRMTVVVPKHPSARSTAEEVAPEWLCTVTRTVAGCVGRHLRSVAARRHLWPSSTTLAALQQPQADSAPPNVRARCEGWDGGGSPAHKVARLPAVALGLEGPHCKGEHRSS